MTYRSTRRRVIGIGTSTPLSIDLRSFLSNCFIVHNLSSARKMEQMSGWRVAAKLEKGRLLLGINSVAALSIFFFGSVCQAQTVRIDH